MKTLNQLDLPWKLLVTMFLAVLSSGFVVSELYLMHTTELADGKPGMSLDDITLNFYGSPMPRLKQQALGPMKRYFSETDDADKLKPEEQADLDKLVAWVDREMPEAEYWDAETKAAKKGQIQSILYDHSCLDCHSPDSVTPGNKRDSPLDTYSAVSKFLKRSEGMGTGRLLSLSHIHLLGMGMMFLLLGMAVAASRWPAWLRSTLIVGGLLSVLLDIFGWWGVKWYGPALSPVVMAGGALMAFAFSVSVIFVLCDLWVRKKAVSSR